jgi:hypothetical protein
MLENNIKKVRNAQWKMSMPINAKARAHVSIFMDVIL